MNQANRRPLVDDYSPAFKGSFDNKEYNLIVYENDIIKAPNGLEYRIIKALGRGQFGSVFLVSENTSDPDKPIEYAMKITKSHPEYIAQAKLETQILSHIQNNSTQEEMSNLLRLVNTFEYRQHIVIVTEILSDNLYDILAIRDYQGIPIIELQTIIKSILEGLRTIQRHQIIHSDLKPENILRINNESSKIKIVDFGSSRFASQPFATYIQSRYYRAPEVILRLPHSYSIDMWSLGCVAAELLVGLPIFPGNSETQMLLYITERLGPFPANLIQKSPMKHIYFDEHGHVRTEQDICRLLRQPLPSETDRYTILKYSVYSSLSDIIKNYGIFQQSTEKEFKNKELFLDLLLKMLIMDPEKRITPEEALNHPFITSDLT